MKTKNSKVLCILLICLVGISACKKINTEVENEVSPKEIYYDIERIKIDISSTYSAIREFYDPAPFEQLQEEVLAGKLSRKETIYRLKRILSDYKIIHLSISPIRYEFNKIAPFEFYCFGSNYYVISANIKYSKYLGWKLKGIGGLSVSEAVEKIAEFSSVETPAGKKYYLENLIDFEDYYYYGLTDNGKIRFILESKDGTTKELNCNPVFYCKLCTVFLFPNRQTPFTKIHLTKANYAVVSASEISTLYLPYIRFSEMKEYSLTTWLNDILKELRSYRYSTIVFDLRHNPGGKFDQMLYQRFFNTNKEELEKYNIAIVTTGRTASAACWFTNELLTNFPHAKIFGEETAQAVYNNTGVMPQVLKKLNCYFCFPSYAGEGNFPKLIERSTDIYRGIMPDVEVFEDIESYLKGEDAIYKAIYEYYNKKD